MLLTIDIKDSAIDKIMYFIEHLKDDVTIVENSHDKSFDIEVINKDDPDYKYILEAREARNRGEKTYSLDDVIKELE